MKSALATLALLMCLAVGSVGCALAAPTVGVGWTSRDKLVMSYLFYWYDVMSGMHIVDGDGSDALTDHPVNLDEMSYNSVDWWKSELTDMSKAGIDVALPVYWGSDSELGWAKDSLEYMVMALDALAAEGKQTPKIGMFFDTSALWQQNGHTNPDLRSAKGQALFYGMMKDFFSSVPMRHWGFIDGKAIVSLYTAAFTSGHSQKTFSYAKQEFEKDFGRSLFIIKEISWSAAEADDVYAWGAALAGPNFHGMAAVGPGYDDSAVPGRTTPKRDRADGAFYEDSWKRVLSRPIPPVRVVVETWNEFHEGTEIAETVEYGRKYIDMTAKYAQSFKAGVKLTPPPSLYGHAASVSISLGRKNEERGLALLDNEDGLHSAVDKGGREGRSGVPNKGGMYLYFGVDDDWMSYADSDVDVTFEYLDAGRGTITVQYDSNNSKATLGGAYTDSKSVSLKGTGKWLTAKLTLKQVKFAGRQNAGADLRVALPNTETAIGLITITK